MLGVNCVEITGHAIRTVKTDTTGPIQFQITFPGAPTWEFLTPMTDWEASDMEWVPVINEPELKITKDPVRLYLYCNQDHTGNQTWYAFLKPEHKALCLRICKAPGVGPKKAITIMTRNGSERLLAILETGDQEAFCKLPGLSGADGLKIATTVFKELPKRKAGVKAPLPAALILDDAAVAAMKAMGFTASDAKERVTKAQKVLFDKAKTPEEKAAIDTESIVKAAL